MYTLGLKEKDGNWIYKKIKTPSILKMWLDHSITDPTVVALSIKKVGDADGEFNTGANGSDQE